MYIYFMLWVVIQYYFINFVVQIPMMYFFTLWIEKIKRLINNWGCSICGVLAAQSVNCCPFGTRIAFSD